MAEGESMNIVTTYYEKRGYHRWQRLYNLFSYKRFKMTQAERVHTQEAIMRAFLEDCRQEK